MASDLKELLAEQAMQDNESIQELIKINRSQKVRQMKMSGRILYNKNMLSQMKNLSYYTENDKRAVQDIIDMETRALERVSEVIIMYDEWIREEQEKIALAIHAIPGLTSYINPYFVSFE